MMFAPIEIPDNVPKNSNLKIKSYMMEGYLEGKYKKVTNNFSSLNND